MTTDNRTHGLRATYRAGCRCPECKRARYEYDRATLFNQCPTCPAQKSKRAKRCAECAKQDPHNLGSIQRSTYREAITPVSVKTNGNPSWRPAWYPPACTACNGFGYLPPGWGRCGACRHHPGHSCSHTEWTAMR